MHKLLICTVGTSIANQCPVQRDMMKRHIPWEDADSGDGAELRKQIAAYLNAEGSDPRKPENLKAVCAEINVLSRLNVDPADRIVLLASDNAQGRISAEMVKKAGIAAFGVSEAAVEIRRIEGLQVLDAKKLRETGLKNLVKIMLEYLAGDEIRYRYDIILNPTGGYKSVVPFITILGMLYGRRCVYLFEFAEELINLPPLPFSFDLQLYRRVRPALAFLEKEVAVSEDAFFAKIENYDPAEHDMFMAFTESFDEHSITISALAYCLYAIDIDKEEKPFLSETALADLKKAAGTSALVLKRLIHNSMDPIWRNRHFHSVFTSDLLVIKQGHTSERIAGFVKDRRFLITNVFDNHDDYAANIGNYKKSDFENARFVPYEDTDHAGVDDDDRDAVIDERDNLLVENKQLRDELAVSKKATEVAIKEAEIKAIDGAEHLERFKHLEERLDSTIAMLKKREERIVELEAELAAGGKVQKKPYDPYNRILSLWRTLFGRKR
jgi:putative CRISPR-associated protein (TIGR02619 family)